MKYENKYKNQCYDCAPFVIYLPPPWPPEPPGGFSKEYREMMEKDARTEERLRYASMICISIMTLAIVFMPIGLIVT